jgi:ankyrin repeat protein
VKNGQDSAILRFVNKGIDVRKKLLLNAGIAVIAATSGLVHAAPADSRLLEAVKRQDGAEIAALLQARIDVNAPHPDGTTALHWASYHDDVRTVEMLIRAGANVNKATDAGITPLWIACSTNSSAALVDRLLVAGANPNLAPNTGETPLMWCARAGALESVKDLVAHQAQVDAREKSSDQTALMWAAAARHPEVVKTLLEVGADPRARTKVTSELVYKGFRYITAPPAHAEGIIDHAKRGGFTPLLFAAQQGDRLSAEALISADADINDADASGASVLLVATHSGHGDLAQLLLDRGADPNAAGAGYTPLHAAVLRGDAALVRALLARGADPGARLQSGTPVRKYGVDYALSAAWIGATPYWLAAKFAEPEIMRLLAEVKANTRLPISDGTTPLMAALMDGQGQGDRRERFQTEVQVAAAAPMQEAATVKAVSLALELGADVDAATATGDTALHLAATRGQLPVIKLLVGAGAPLDVKNKRGLTPLAAAASRRRPGDVDGGAAAAAASQSNPTVELLRSLGAKD